MSQLFPPSSNTVAPVAVLGVITTLCLLAVGIWLVFGSPYMTAVGVPINQPVPFSHEHHVGGLGIDCRYCHVSVERASFAGMPSTHTCMTCHSQLWTEAELLAPVRQSLEKNEPIRWNRVHSLPDYVYFNHSIHIAKGVGCVSCHGRVDEMPLVAKAETLYMRWCLDCHIHPEPALRAHDEVFNLASKPPTQAEGVARAKANDVRTAHLTDCSACHR